jgi:SCY1-like protein 1
MAAAKGEMEPAAQANGAALLQAQSLPPSGRTTPTINVIREKTTATPSRLPTSQTTRTQVPSPAQQDNAWEEEGDTLDAWGTMDDEGDSFFDAPSATKTSTPEPAAAFDDGGEPDFAGWLAAQSKAKSQKPLPKGLAKTNTTASTLNVRPAAPTRSVSAGVAATSASSRRPAVATTKSMAPVAAKKEIKKEASKPKEPAINDDDWGEAWD